MVKSELFDIQWSFDLHRCLTLPLDESLRGLLVVDDGESLCLTIGRVKAAVENALSISCKEVESRHSPKSCDGSSLKAGLGRFLVKISTKLFFVET